MHYDYINPEFLLRELILSVIPAIPESSTMPRDLIPLIHALHLVVEEYRSRLIELEDAAERELAAILLGAEREVIRMIERGLRVGMPTMDQAVGMVQQAGKIVNREVTKKGLSWVDDHLSLAYRNGSAFVRDTYLTGEGIGKMGLQGLKKLDEDIIRAAFLNFTPADEATFASGTRRGYTLIRQIDDDVRIFLRENFVRHIALGSDTNTLAEAIVEGGQLKPIGGRTLETRAQAISRTELARIHEEAAAVKSKEVGIEHFRWDAEFDHRTGKDSIRRHGRIKTHEQWDRYKPDRFIGRPPMRPNDRCQLVAMRRTWIRDDRGREDFDRAIREDLRILWGPQERAAIEQAKGVANDFLN